MSAVRLLALVGVVVVVLGVGTVVLVNASWMPWNDLTSCDLPGSVATGAPSDASGIRVVEQGFSQSADFRVSMGATVVNTGKDIAYQTRVSVQAFDSTQQPMGAPTVVQVPVLLPGQPVGIGQETWLTAGTHAASVRIVPETTHRLPATALGSYRPITATQPRTSHPDPLFAEDVDIHYTDTSTNCGPLSDEQAAVVYRDAHGKIVGGVMDVPGSLIVYKNSTGANAGGELRLPNGEPCDPGTRDMWVTPDGEQPAAADPARTAIYQYCDLSGAKPSNP